MSVQTQTSFNDLSWEISFNSETKIISAIFSGYATVKSLSAFTRSFAIQQSAHDIQAILLDYSSAQSDLRFADIYYQPQAARESGLKPQTPTAVVLTTSNKVLTKFIEDVFVNRGFTFQVFDKSEDALEWLHTKIWS